MSFRRMAGVVATFLVAATTHLAHPTPAYGFETGAETQFVSLVNAARAAKGVGPLAVDPALTRVARDWSTQMSEGVGLAHNPALRSIIDSITSVWRKYGENVAYGGSVDAIHRGLVNSPHHYENLMSAEFTTVGIGVVLKGRTLWVTQDFLTGATGGSPPTTAAPRPRPTTTTTAARPRAVTRPTTPTTVRPPVVQPPPAPPAPPAIPLRVRAALETEQLMERLLHPAGARALTRAR